MVGRGRADVLKVDEAKVVRNHCRSCGRDSSVGGYGMCAGADGGGPRRESRRGAAWKWGDSGTSVAWAAIAGRGEGKEGGITRSCLHAERLRKRPLTPRMM